MSLNPCAFLFALALFCLPTPAHSWGRTGHVISAHITDARLTPQGREAIYSILGSRTLAQAALHPDEMRGDPEPFWRRIAPAYHYVTVRGDSDYDATRPPAKGDAVTALRLFSHRLLDESSTHEEKFVALSFIIHIVEDLHQPLHVGNGLDRGGNDYQVSASGVNTNMHALWDEVILTLGGIGEGSADELNNAITEAQAREWSVVDPTVWIAESLSIRRGAYPVSHRVREDYLRDNLKVGLTRIQQAGIRTAAYLNCLFDQRCAPGMEALRGKGGHP